MSASRTAQPSFVARIRSLWLIAVMLLALACVAIVAFANAPQLRVRSIDVKLPDGAPVSRDAVLAAAAIAPDANVVLLRAGAIARRIEAIPYVAQAYVRRTVYPQPAVRLVATMRTPYACVIAANGPATIDAGARVLQVGCASANLPSVDVGDLDVPAPGAILDDPDAASLLVDLKAVAAQLPVRRIVRDRFGGLDVVDGAGVRIRFGDDRNLADKLALVEPVRQAAHGRRLVGIDLRAPATPVITYP